MIPDQNKFLKKIFLALLALAVTGPLLVNDAVAKEFKITYTNCKHRASQYRPYPKPSKQYDFQ